MKDFDKKIVLEYLTGQYTKTELWKKYTGQEEEHGEILRWMRKLGYVSTEEKNITMKQASSKSRYYHRLTKQEEEKSVQDQVNDLSEQLKMAQVQLEGYQIMIELAEKEFKIQIRKKSNTK